jgi:hypothetical protein
MKTQTDKHINKGMKDRRRIKGGRKGGVGAAGYQERDPDVCLYVPIPKIAAPRYSCPCAP